MDINIEDLFNDIQKNALVSYLDTENRSDASPTIRGFIFQNLFAVHQLFDSGIDGVVFCECVEDVFFYGIDGSAKAFQAKCYKDRLESDSLCEVAANLFYDYKTLYDCFKVSNYILCCNNNEIYTIPDYSQVVDWIIKTKEKMTDKQKDSKSKFNRVSQTFLDSGENVYRDFSKLFKCCSFVSVSELKKSASSLLLKYFNQNANDIDTGYIDEEALKNILLSLTYQYVLGSLERTTTDSHSKLNARRLSRSEVFDEWKFAFGTADTSLPQKVVISLIDEIYMSLIDDNKNMSEEINEALDIVYEDTKRWIKNLFSSEEGQLSFIKTVSKQNLDECNEWNKKTSKDKTITIYKAYEGIRSFFGYLWKIIIDLHIENGKENNSLNVADYLEATEGYIKFRYGTKDGVILPDVGSHRLNDIYAYLSRLKRYTPRIWYMNCDSSIRHKYSYNIPINVGPDDSNKWKIDNVKDDSIFIIECMKCVSIEAGGWEKTENCDDHIFSDKCGGESKW